MRFFLLSSALVLCAMAHAQDKGVFVMQPAPFPTALPEPTLDANPPVAALGASPTAVPGTTVADSVYLVPFKDSRRSKEVFTGKSTYDSVVMEPAGATGLASAWRKRPYGDISYLLHCQLAASLVQAGYRVQAAASPQPDLAGALFDAKTGGDKWLVSGEITRLTFTRRGADGFWGTNFNGTNYFLNLEAKILIQDVSNGAVKFDDVVKAERLFYDPKSMGVADIDQYAGYFITGLPDIGQQVASNVTLRQISGLPTFTVTPTPVSALAVLVVTPTPTPDAGPHWINPKTRKRVDPSWNFDPADGTPRAQFVLETATAAAKEKP
jgi:hypothetical protein